MISTPACVHLVPTPVETGPLLPCHSALGHRVHRAVCAQVAVLLLSNGLFGYLWKNSSRSATVRCYENSASMFSALLLHAVFVVVVVVVSVLDVNTGIIDMVCRRGCCQAAGTSPHGQRISSCCSLLPTVGRPCVHHCGTIVVVDDVAQLRLISGLSELGRQPHTCRVSPTQCMVKPQQRLARPRYPSCLLLLDVHPPSHPMPCSACRRRTCTCCCCFPAPAFFLVHNCNSCGVAVGGVS